ncbi:hypothetical protein [Luteolibacter marinus]|uniref:hypothetical protein n=1 Tax=Luteolibacter marinus TaxID=2776705 RepID=UPI001866E023|nr:hypothetical protein [Luteolibacter marinus]
MVAVLLKTASGLLLVLFLGSLAMSTFLVGIFRGNYHPGNAVHLLIIVLGVLAPCSWLLASWRCHAHPVLRTLGWTLVPVLVQWAFLAGYSLPGARGLIH